MIKDNINIIKNRIQERINNTNDKIKKRNKFIKMINFQKKNKNKKNMQHFYKIKWNKNRKDKKLKSKKIIKIMILIFKQNKKLIIKVLWIKNKRKCSKMSINNF